MKPWENYAIAINGRPIKDNFADWFSGSKVVDKHGKPLVVYRGYNGEHERANAFESTNRGTPTFTDDPDMASAFAELTGRGAVGQYYLSISNPLSFDNESFVSPNSAFLQSLDGGPEYIQCLQSEYEDFAEDGIDNYFIADDPRFVSIAKKNGYDGLVYVGSNHGEEVLEYRPFYPEQVKSALGNSGLYCKHTPDTSDQLDQSPEPLYAQVRISDIIPHETPNPRTVNKIAKAIKAGEAIPPVLIDPNPCKHWTQGPTEMEFTGYGFGLIDGHHRLEALKKVFGPNHAIEVQLHRPRAQAQMQKAMSI